jgi:transposase
MLIGDLVRERHVRESGTRLNVVADTHDIMLAPSLTAAAGPIRHLIAVKAYDANSLRQLLSDHGAKAVIPSTTSRRQPIPYNKALYRQRNLIERMFARLKDF